MAVDPLFSLAALVLLFFLPGYLLMKALWPEHRVRGPGGRLWLLQVLAGGVVLSTVLSILIGFYLGNVGLFQAGPSQPYLEALLGALSAVFFVAGWFRGAFARTAPAPAPVGGEELPAEDDTGDYWKSLEEMARTERRLRHEIRSLRKSGKDDRVPTQELNALTDRRKQLQQSRESLLRSTEDQGH